MEPIDNFNKEVVVHFKQLKDKYDAKALDSINYEGLLVLFESLTQYKPESKIQNKRKLFLDYLQILCAEDISNHSTREKYKLQGDYILKIVNQIPGKGYRIKNAWIMTYFLFILPIEVIFYWIGINKFFINIPLISFVFIFNQYRRDLKAKKNISCGKF